MQILHLVHIYLPIRLIWLYRLIGSHKKYSPSVFSFEYREGLPEVTSYHYFLDNHKLTERLNKIFFRLFGIFPVIKKIIKEQEIDILHGHFGNFSYRFLKTAISMEKPLVTSFYGRDLSSLAKKKKNRRRYGILFEKGDCFIVEGPAAKEALVKLGCPEDKIRIVHFGIYPEEIPFKLRKYEKKEKFNILMASGLAEKKGHRYAIEAISMLLKRGRDITFSIIGSGEQKKNIESLIESIGIGNKVKMIEGMSYKELIENMHSAHIFLHPSVTASNGDTEGGAPVVLLDAMASGLPVISSYHADIPAIVPDKKAGLLSPEKDVNKITENIEYLMDNPEKLAELSKYGREHIEKNHNWHVQIEKIESIYSDCLKNKQVIY